MANADKRSITKREYQSHIKQFMFNFGFSNPSLCYSSSLIDISVCGIIADSARMEWRHCVITQINIDKTNKCQGNIIIFD